LDVTRTGEEHGIGQNGNNMGQKKKVSNDLLENGSSNMTRSLGPSGVNEHA